MNDEGFDDIKVSANADFGFGNNYDSAVTDLGSENNNDGFNDDIAINDVKTELKQFDALCRACGSFLVILTCYCFRRGTANVVDRRFFLTFQR